MKKLSIKMLSIMLITIIVGATGLVGCSQKDDSKLRVGIALTYAPFHYLDDNGEPAGLEVDIAKAFSEYVGREIVIENYNYDTLLTKLKLGDIDVIISDMGYNEERASQANFSDTYRYNKTYAMVNKEFAEENNICDSYGVVNKDMTDEEFFGIEDAIYTGYAGTISILYPQSFGVSADNLKIITDIAIGRGDVASNNEGTADVLVGKYLIFGDQAKYPDETIVYECTGGTDESGFVFNKNETELLEKANEFIASMYAEGGFYDLAIKNKTYDEFIQTTLNNESLTISNFVLPPTI